MALVALCNDYTTCLTISAAYTTGLDSFEALANWAGGPHWKVRDTAAGLAAAARQQQDNVQVGAAVTVPANACRMTPVHINARRERVVVRAVCLLCHRVC